MSLVNAVFEEAKKYLKSRGNRGLGGHDFAHASRVCELCEIIGEAEKADLVVVQVAALLHDLGRSEEMEDRKTDHALRSAEIAEDLLNNLHCPQETIARVSSAIRDHRFSKGIPPRSLEAKILQDADRVDISGAIGIAMTFAYGGRTGQELYCFEDPFAEKRPLDVSKYSVDHFYAKILLIPENLHTKLAKELVQSRQQFLICFLEQLRREIRSETKSV